MKKAIFMSAVIPSILLCGCYCRRVRCTDDVTTYAQRAHLEQQAYREQGAATWCFDEQEPAMTVLDLEECDDTGEWVRQPYETVDEWLERMQHCLCLNRDTICNLQNEYEQLQAREQELAIRIQSFIRKNEHLRELRSQLGAEQRQDSDFEDLSSDRDSPFSIYLVQRGETLYSIAMKHYHSGEMVRNIMRWNQGWIRHPDEVIAGLGLVLFPAEYPEAGQKVVINYLEELQEQKN